MYPKRFPAEPRPFCVEDACILDAKYLIELVRVELKIPYER